MTEEYHAFAQSHAQPGPLQIRSHDLAASASAFTQVHQSVRQSAQLCRSHIVSKPVEANATQQPASSLCQGCELVHFGFRFHNSKARTSCALLFSWRSESHWRANARLPNGKSGATPLARAHPHHHHFRWTWSRRQQIPPRANGHFRSRLRVDVAVQKKSLQQLQGSQRKPSRMLRWLQGNAGHVNDPLRGAALERFRRSLRLTLLVRSIVVAMRNELCTPRALVVLPPPLALAVFWLCGAVWCVASARVTLIRAYRRYVRKRRSLRRLAAPVAPCATSP